jgi:hypothetical protein
LGDFFFISFKHWFEKRNVLNKNMKIDLIDKRNTFRLINWKLNFNVKTRK